MFAALPQTADARCRFVAGCAVAALAVLATSGLATADPIDPQVNRGRYLIHAGGCTTCHTEDRDDAVPLAGGRALNSPFGTFYSPNITPHVTRGIGAWTDDEFVQVLQDGLNPQGKAYFPAFP
jgi:hypothetical protein